MKVDRLERGRFCLNVVAILGGANSGAERKAIDDGTANHSGRDFV